MLPKLSNQKVPNATVEMGTKAAMTEEFSFMRCPEIP